MDRASAFVVGSVKFSSHPLW